MTTTSMQQTSQPPTLDFPRRLRTRPRTVGALALGAFAVGALALGALAIGKLRIRDARIGRLEIDELVVRRLSVLDQLDAPPR